MISNLRISLLIVLLSASTAFGQNTPSRQEPGLRLKADLIEVRAVVTDRKGRVIENLKKEEFELLENGRPQEIGFFSLETVGAALDNRPRPDGLPGRTQQKAARSILIFVDNLHIAPSNLATVKHSLKEFVDKQVSDQDLVSLVMSTGSLGLLGQFTNRRQLLRYAVERISAVPQQESLITPYLASLVDRGDREAMAVAQDIIRAEEGFTLTGGESSGFSKQALENYALARAREVLSSESYRRRVMLLVLKAATERLAQMPGQRILAFLTDGFTMLNSSGSADTNDLQSAISSAVRSGIVIYSVNTRGLEVSPLFDASMPSLTVGGLSGSLGNADRYFSSSDRELQDGMNALARDTGGKPFFNTNDLGGALRKAMDENKVYYALAYYPHDQKEGKFNKITLRVKNHPEYEVRAQKGYYAPKPEERKTDVAAGPRDRLFQAMAEPLPVTNIEVAATAEYLESEADDAQVTLQVHIDGERLGYQAQQAGHLLDVEVASVIFDSKGKPVKNSINSVRWNLLAEGMEMGKQHGYRYTERVALKPGFYELRVGVREPASNLVGTAIAWVEVPKLERGKLTMSSIVLSRRERAQSSAKFVGAKSALGVKFYRGNDALVYQLMVYNAKKRETELMIRPEIFQGEEAIYQGEFQPLSSRLLRADKKGFEAGGQVELGKLAPGIYELRITIKESRSKQVRQSVVFGVEP
ncbi:MAG TPA: VWA domain-containing protein [Blastocatellia bacterium]|nr:VWA domain-containing protein [Blastocatellia bacterium]